MSNFSQAAVDTIIKQDKYSAWMGIEVLEIKEGYSKIKMIVRNEMLNGFGIAHGGVTFSFADSAFAFACNYSGKISVALEVSISFTKPCLEGDELIAEAKKISETNKTGLYVIEIKNQHDHLVALVKGTCYKTEKNLM